MRLHAPSLLPRLSSAAFLIALPLLGLPPALRAETLGFISEFDIGNWNFTSGGTGSSFTSSSSVISLWGSQNADDIPTQATYTTNVSGAFTVSFDWSYVTNDSGGSQYDPAGHLDGTSLQLSDDLGPSAQSGSVSNFFFTGGTFGFYAIADNYHSLPADGFSTLTISNFSFTPASLPLWTGAAGAAWNNAANWNSVVGAPNRATMIAEFGTSAQTAVTIDAATELKGLRFNATAPAYTITVPTGQEFSLGSGGLRNLSSTTQNLTVDSGGTLRFSGGGTISGGVAVSNSGALFFNNTASAGSAVITTGSVTNWFTGSSSAGTATVNLLTGAEMDFFQNATAGSATFNLSSGSSLFFSDNATAANAAVNLASGGSLDISGLGAVTGTLLGSLTGTGSVFLGQKELVVGTNGASMVFGGVLQDGGVGGVTGGSLTKAGSGSLTLSGPNSHTGRTTLEAGTLILGLNTTLAGSTLDHRGGTLSFGSLTDATLGGLMGTQNIALTNASAAPVELSVGANGANTSYAGVLSGDGSLVKTGTGVLTLSGANTYQGATTLAGGTLRLDGAAALSGSSNVRFDGGVLGLPSGLSGFTLGAGPGQVQWVGDGGFAAYGAARTVTLNGGASLAWGGTAGFVADGSALVLGSADSDATITLSNALGLGGLDRTVLVNRGSGPLDAVLSGNLSGTGGLIKTGEGLLSLTGVNTYTGATRVAGGGLLMGGSSNLPAGSNLQLDGGVLALGAGSPFGFTLGSGPGQIQWVGGGGLAASGGNRPVTFNGGAGLAWGATSGFVPDGSALVLGGSFGNATLTLTNALDLGSSDRTVRVDDGAADLDAILSGVISGSGGLGKTGAGTLVLQGANTYTGGTYLGGGVLEFSSLGNLGTGGAITFDGGVLRYAAGNTADISGRTVTFGPGDGAVDTNGNNVTFANPIGDASSYGFAKLGAGTLTLAGQGSGFYNTTVSEGTLALAGGGTAESGDLIVGTRSGVTADFGISESGSEWLAGLVFLGFTPGSEGRATVSNGGHLDADTVFIGLAGNGSFTVESGGLVTAITTTVGLGGTGSLLLDGGGWETDDWAVIGYGGTGSLTIRNGGHFHNLDTSFGTEVSYVGTGGSVLVTGAGSEFISEGGLALGYYGHADVTVEQGGLMASGTSYVGGTGSGSADVVVTTGGSWVINSNDDPFLTPALQIGTSANASSLTVDQGGLVNLTGSNGLIWVRELGTLTLGTGGQLVAGTVVNDGNVLLTPTDTIVFDAGIENSGSLVKSGAGTAIITGGIETFPGGTNAVNGGTLQLGNGGPVAAISGDLSVASGASLVFNTSNTVTYSEVISGGGSVTQAGADTLIFSGANSYSGGTFVTSGTLRAGDAGSFGSGNVTVGGSGILDLGGQAVANTIANQGGRVLGAESYAGTQTLSGVSTYTGTVGGTLSVSRSGVVQGSATFTGGVTVNAGGAVRGTGTFAGGLVLAAGGTVGPGNSPGTIALASSGWNGGAFYEWELNSVAADRGVNQDFISITGTLTITATSLNPFVIKVVSLDSGGGPGGVSDFVSAHPGYFWTIAEAGNIVGFDAAAFRVDLTGFANASNHAAWQVQQVGNSLNLVYVPEPSTWAVLAGIGALGLALGRRNRRR